MSKARAVKQYRDPYGKNRPRSAGQTRCRNRRCSCLLWHTTAEEYDGLCANCWDENRIRELTKNM